MAIVHTAKQGKTLKALDIEIAVARYFNTRVNLIVPNISRGMGLHECDLLIITKNNYAYEVEIKVSLSDLKKDVEKQHNHGMTVPKVFEGLIPVNDKIRELYFAIPNYLLKYQHYIPEQAGIITVEEGGRCETIREAKIKSEYRFTDDEKFNVARLGTMRIWSLKSKLRERRDVVIQQV